MGYPRTAHPAGYHPPQKAVFNDYEVEHDFPRLGKRTLLLNARRIPAPPKEAQWILLAFEDVSERMRLERILKASEHRFHEAFDTAPDCILLVDKTSGRVLNSNRAAQHTFALFQSEAAKNESVGTGHPERFPAIRQISEELEKKGTVEIFDKTIHIKGGGQLPADIYLMDRTGVIQCNIRDITEHKRIIVALQENEKKYHDLVNQSPDGVFIIELSGKILTVNKAMCKELGFSEEEFLSMSIWDIIPEQYLDQHRKRLTKIFEGKSLEEAAEYAVRGKDGKMHYIEVLSAPHYSGKDIIGFQGIARDITAQKEAEEALLASEARYRHTLDDMFEGCQILGFDWRYLYVNDAAAWHGHQAKETLVGHTMMEIYPDIENTELFAALRRCMNERTSHQMENEFAYPDGMKGWFELRIQPVPEGVFILSIDITAHKQAEEALQRSQQETAHVNSLLVALSQAAQSVQRALTTEEVYRAIQDQMSDLGLHATGFELEQEGKRLRIAFISFRRDLVHKAEKARPASHCILFISNPGRIPSSTEP